MIITQCLSDPERKLNWVHFDELFIYKCYVFNEFLMSF